MRKFDLNIEKVLEHWTTAHALREIIANALDESKLTNTSEPEIFKDDSRWHIKDFGRGIKYEHLTQNENSEKTENPDKVIGKFGVGLKDALATFDRRNINVLIQSKYSDISIEKVTKANFDDLVTLHAIVKEPTYPNMIGTEFIFTGLSDQDISQAKEFFLMYSEDKVIEETKYGEVIKNNKGHSKIYVNGLCVAEEENFLFSYNITSTTKQLRKSLNRERNNVGRTAYSDRVKSILLECDGHESAERLIDDLQGLEIGTAHDELQWIDVQVHACKILSTKEKVLFLTARDIRKSAKYLDYAQEEAIQIITVPDVLANKLGNTEDLDGNKIRNLSTYVEQWNDQFKFDIVPENKLTKSEREIFNYKDIIMSWYPKRHNVVKEILISNTMRPDNYTGSDAFGIWIPSTKQIIIKRSQLKHIESFSGTLIHELVHAYTGTDDNTIEFESELTKMLGNLSIRILKTNELKESKSIFKRLLNK